MLPTSTIVWRTTAACARPVTGCMTSRDLLAKPVTAMTASRQNISAAPMAITRSSGCSDVMSPAVKETTAAATASTRAMMERHGRAWSLTLATCLAEVELALFLQIHRHDPPGTVIAAASTHATQGPASGALGADE